LNKILIDGHHLAHKSFHAYNLSTADGLPSGCVYGFLVTLRALKKRFRDFHFVVSWDNDAKRKKKIYADYKSNRNHFSLDDPIIDLKKALSSLNITQIEMVDEEADDVIASYVEKNKKDGLIYVYSSDKDLFQLIEDGKVIVIKPKTGGYPEKFFDEEAVLDRYGVTAGIFPCFQAFRGDSIDTIPGVPYLPSKLISSLTSKYREPTNIYSNLSSEEMTDNQRNKIIAHEEQVYINYEIMRLKRDLDYSVVEGENDVGVLNEIVNKYEIESISTEGLVSMFDKESGFLQKQAPAVENISLF